MTLRLARQAAMVVALLLTAGPVWAQAPKENLPRFAVDVHGGLVGLPTTEGWIPVVTDDTVVPGRAFGFSGGVNVYLLKLGAMTFGVGVQFATGKGTGEPPVVAATPGTPAPPPTTPIVTTQVTNVVPHLSMNFGHRFGWSYLSAGYGQSKVSSSTSAVGTVPAVTIPESWNPALNFGGGAKWFMKRHLGASFDVRFTKLSSRGATETLPSAKRTQTVTMSVGISIQ